MKYRALIHPDQTVTFPGIDFSNGTKALTYAGGKGGLFVIRHPGGKCWDGNYSPQRTVRAKFIVFKILKKVRTNAGFELLLDELFDLPIRGVSDFGDIPKWEG